MIDLGRIRNDRKKTTRLKKLLKDSYSFFYFSGSFFNSDFWYHIYYKHTKKHRAELKSIRDRIVEIRFKSIGK